MAKGKKLPEALSILWFAEPEDHNYPAALSYLSLLFPRDEAIKLVEQLKLAEVVEFKAKDIFRASKLSLLGVSNGHVARDQKKIRKGIELSPILLVRDPVTRSVIIADGYHRMCAIYSFNEDAWIRCKIV